MAHEPSSSNKCPCGSGLNYSECCQRYHNGELPENPLALMRSRYSAYAKHLPQYIMETTHPKNAQHQTNKEAWSQAIMNFCQNTTFERLEILEAVQDTVTFIAYLKQQGKNGSFKEKSRFVKENGRWLYLDGILSTC